MKFEFTTVEPIPDIYSNLTRAQQAVSLDNTDQSDETWKVKDEEDTNSDGYNWQVNFGKTSPIDPDQHLLYQQQ